MDPTTDTVTMEKIVSLCKRRGLIFQNSEIYGGLGSVWDYGPLGVELKRNVKDAWWRSMVQQRSDVVGLDSAILMHPRVWEASGHLESFTDPLVECRECNQRWRDDALVEGRCPNCNGEVGEARMFNLMFKSFMGPVEDDAAIVYLRPETAQGIFVNFENVLNSTRKRLPFGIAQIGKSFRNEITPGNFTFRTREFEQMEMEYFVMPEEADASLQYWVERRFQWYLDLGVRAENLRLRWHDPDELAHYAKATADVEYLFPMGWSELEGIANRTDFDLLQHSKVSGKSLTVFDEPNKRHVTPYVIEPSGGVDRATLAFLVDSYREEEVRGETRVLLKMHKDLCPVQVAVLPLSRNQRLLPLSQQVFDAVRSNFRAQYDDAQSIGRRYRRQDEIGTPLCVTVDFDSLDDNAVTIRDRDTMEQTRVPIERLVDELRSRLDS